ncbi:MAG TPA: D-alanine--D-alanine ligase [Mariniphaga anaerophila]|uniref:D-alanine--D-alanine ligase n=1 Tax=Mariniphaga anaerophila TaxID=1484053 RepID=A0A831LYB8_9BACT|nr:D-alanine--D-alanine ligase [Mariniphaga anaerophila]
MNKKPNIAVIAGGDSSEFVVSVKSGANVLAAIDTEKFTPWLVQMRGDEWIVLQNEKKQADIDKSDFSFSLNGKKIKIDFAWITIHGTPGENGILQGYFDLLHIPYSTSNIHSSSLTFNKWFCNNYLKSFGIKMARSVLLQKGKKINSAKIVKKLGLPLFVKPNAGGSSFGVTKVKSENDLLPAVQKAWEENSDALVEEFIGGTEFTCGLVKAGSKKIVFPVTEVIPKNEFFDFEAKYTPGATDEITPARLPKELYEKCQQLSSEIYDLCQCSGIARVDYIFNGNEFYFLEVNITPGMTETSFIPQQINALGLSLKEIISQVILEGFNRE